MDWYIVNKDYFAYLFQFDNRIGYIDYNDKLKLHIGVVLEINTHKFYVPISSPKPKHHNMSNSIDFHKLLDDNGQLLAVFNLNNMIPVRNEHITLLKYSEIERYRTFKSLKDLNNYVYLLQIQHELIIKIEPILKQKALKLYQKCIQYPTSNLANRCCDFQLLQKKSNSYKP